MSISYYNPPVPPPLPELVEKPSCLKRKAVTLDVPECTEPVCAATATTTTTTPNKRQETAKPKVELREVFCSVIQGGCGSVCIVLVEKQFEFCPYCGLQQRKAN